MPVSNCPKCHAPVAVEARFCSQCGVSLAQEKPGASQPGTGSSGGYGGTGSSGGYGGTGSSGGYGEGLEDTVSQRIEDQIKKVQDRLKK